MTIQMFNPAKDGKTMQCPYCDGEFGLLFCCNGCSQPVCMGCGLLKQPGNTQLFTLVDNVRIPLPINPHREVGMSEWLDSDDTHQQFFCPTCR